MSSAAPQPLALLVSPAARSAYYAEYLAIAGAELDWVVGPESVAHKRVGGMDFLELQALDSQLETLASLSFVHGLFVRREGLLRPLAIEPDYRLHEDFVTGTKYRGKTNETLTQLLINIGLAGLDLPDRSRIKLLDPMCGRGTTLLWAMRYGIAARGIEQDPRALADVRQSIKKWCKLHRQKHRFNQGSVGKANKQGVGRFIEFTAGETSMRLITGDSANAHQLLNGETFHLLVSDLPYGVQYLGREKARNPLATIEACSQAWVDSLKAGGVMVLSFNAYLPKREQLVDLFRDRGLEALEFAAPHRMSESILRDILVLRKPG